MCWRFSVVVASVYRPPSLTVDSSQDDNTSSVEEEKVVVSHQDQTKKELLSSLLPPLHSSSLPPGEIQHKDPSHSESYQADLKELWLRTDQS